MTHLRRGQATHQLSPLRGHMFTHSVIVLSLPEFIGVTVVEIKIADCSDSSDLLFTPYVYLYTHNPAQVQERPQQFKIPMTIVPDCFDPAVRKKLIHLSLAKRQRHIDCFNAVRSM